MATITNLASFKKALTVGRKIACTFHLAILGRNEDKTPIYGDEIKPVREISKVQSNSFAIKTEHTDGKIVDSWCSYPKASECTFENNTCTIYETDREGKKIKVLTYSFPE